MSATQLPLILDSMEARRAYYVAYARMVLRVEAQRTGWVTADDVHRLAPVPEGVDGRIVGAILREPYFVRDGVQPSVRRKINHGRTICRFRLGEGGSVSLAGRSSSAGSPSTLLPSLRRSG